MDDDWSLVVASFQSEYGIRLSKDLHGMSWREFSYLINGLSGDSPLGRIITIRAENDPEVLKKFTKEQKQVRNEYRRKMALEKPVKDVSRTTDNVKMALRKLAER